MEPVAGKSRTARRRRGPRSHIKVFYHQLAEAEAQARGEPCQELRVAAGEGEAGAPAAEGGSDGVAGAGVEREQHGVAVGHAQRICDEVCVSADAWVACDAGNHITTSEDALHGVAWLIGALSFRFRGSESVTV